MKSCLSILLNNKMKVHLIYITPIKLLLALTFNSMTKYNLFADGKETDGRGRLGF